MVYLVVALFVIGVALLVAGYRKNHRNLLLAGAIVLFASARPAVHSRVYPRGSRRLVG